LPTSRAGLSPSEIGRVWRTAASSILATCICDASRSDIANVNEQHNSGTYANLKTAVEFVERLHNAITVLSISAVVAV
jgi:hypothetical protein